MAQWRSQAALSWFVVHLSASGTAVDAWEYLLTGPLDPTNEPYATAKIAGIKICEIYNRQYGTDFRSVMPTNLYGPGDNYHADNSHVIAGLNRRFHEAKTDDTAQVAIWGTGAPRREFLYVDDLARASVHVMELEHRPIQSHINIGVGIDITICSLAQLIAEVVGFQGKIVYDISKPDGAPRKPLDTSLLRQPDWTPSVSIERGLVETYRHFLSVHYPLEGQAGEHA